MLSTNINTKKRKTKPTLIELHKYKQEQKNLKEDYRIIPDDLKEQLLELFKNHTKCIPS